MVLRFLGWVIYVGGFIALRGYLRKHPLEPKSVPVIEYAQPQAALIWMWGPLLWFLPGMLWIGIGVPALPGLGIASLSIFVPLSIFLLFLLAVGLFPKALRSVKFVFSITPILAFVTLIIMLTLAGILVAPGLDLMAFLLFLAFITIPPVIAILLVCVWVPEIIPLNLDQENRWLTALKIFTAYFTACPKPVWVVEDGKAETRIRGSQFFGFGPGWLMTEPENVVVLQGGTDIKRIVGPGVVLTEPLESPYQVVDLRNQIRVAKIDAVTRDGIEVKLPISSLFRIDRGYKTIDPDSLKRHEPWPYRNKRDIYQVVFAEEVDPTGKTPLEAPQARSWDDVPLTIAKHQLKREIPRYDFEKLYGKDPDANTLTRSIIGKTVREAVKNVVEPVGFEIIAGGVGNKIVPNNEEVAKQQVEAWKAGWISKVKEWRAEAQAKRLQISANVRSEARVDLLTKLLDQTQQSFQGSDGTDDYVAYHLLENLLHIARDPQVKDLLPESAIPTLSHLRRLAQEDDDED